LWLRFIILWEEAVMGKIILLRGLPASGKSTFAKEYVAKHPKSIRINNDDLRDMFHDGKWSSKNESVISKARNILIETFLLDDFTVLIDNVNLNPKHRKTMKGLAETYGAKFEVRNFPIEPQEAIKRDLNRHRSVGKDVIMRFYDDYVKPKPQVYKPPKNTPTAIVCDIDGTLAHMDGKRSPFEWHKVKGDRVDEAILNLLEMSNDEGHTIILLSGRDSGCRDVTEQWLEEKDIPFDHLYMRSAGDNRKDTIVKEELFDAHIRNEFNVLFIIDDRPSVCRMWRSLGLKVLQVGDPHNEF